jgi:hypothetical protein
LNAFKSNPYTQSLQSWYWTTFWAKRNTYVVTDFCITFFATLFL